MMLCELISNSDYFIFSEKVRLFVSCAECGKRRIVYSKTKLSTSESHAVVMVEEELLYTCGNTLFPPDHALYTHVVVREGINCRSQIETSYYAGKIQLHKNVLHISTFNTGKLLKLYK